MSTTHYSQNKTLFPLSGGCPCGLIRFSLDLPPLLVHCCSCTACQRQTGSIMGLNVVIESSALTLLSSASPSVAGSPSSPEQIPTACHPAFARTTSSTPPPGLDSPAPVAVCIPSESTLGQTVMHCPSCHAGLWVYYADAGPHISYVRLGTLDRPWDIEPDVHIYTRSRKGYLSFNDGKPEFEDYYPSREALLRPDALERFQKLKPAIDEWWKEMKAELK